MERTHLMTGLEGTYLGFSPTDESAVMLGELEVKIDDRSLVSRMATGLEIRVESVPLTDFRQLLSDEIASMLQGGIEQAVRYRVYHIGDAKFLFLPDASDEEPGLLITGGLADLLGPTFLYNPGQVERGLFERAVATIEGEFGRVGVIPRLNNRG